MPGENKKEMSVLAKIVAGEVEKIDENNNPILLDKDDHKEIRKKLAHHSYDFQLAMATAFSIEMLLRSFDNSLFFLSGEYLLDSRFIIYLLVICSPLAAISFFRNLIWVRDDKRWLLVDWYQRKFTKEDGFNEDFIVDDSDQFLSTRQEYIAQELGKIIEYASLYLVAFHSLPLLFGLLILSQNTFEIQKEFSSDLPIFFLYCSIYLITFLLGKTAKNLSRLAYKNRIEAIFEGKQQEIDEQALTRAEETLSDSAKESDDDDDLATFESQVALL
jgi:hypothetical protein